MAAMFRYIESGSYVADTTRQTQLFGPPPTAGDAIARLLRDLGHLSADRTPGGIAGP